MTPRSSGKKSAQPASARARKSEPAKPLSIRQFRGSHDLVEIPSYGGQEIKNLRERYNISQAVLAHLLNTNLSTVQHWEIGVKNPTGAALKLLSILDRQGLGVLLA